MNGVFDYSHVFNHLSHMLALSQHDKLKPAVDSVVVTALTISSGTRSFNVQDVAQVIRAVFGLALAEQLVQSSLDRLMTRGDLIREAQSRAFVVSPSAAASVMEKINSASVLEMAVRDEWIDELGVGDQPGYVEELWACLRAYMARAFQRHGAQTVVLLDPRVPITDENRKHLSTYLDEAIREACSIVPRNVALEAVRHFFKASTLQRTKYLAQLLDGTFTYFALSVDKATSAYLRAAISPLSLFLDTNFIFGVLDIHSSDPISEVSQQLIDFITTNRLPFKLYYHDETLRELEQTISMIGNRLRGRKWTQELSRAAVRSGRLAGLELRYHEANANSPIEPDVFLSKYAYLEALLSDLGFKRFQQARVSPEMRSERHRLVADYSDYIERHRPKGPKPYDALNHDIAVWQTVRQMRKSSASPLDVGAFFLTTDYYFYSFDWQCLRRQNALGLAVLPNQFLQLIRPFVTSTDDSDHRFVETFAIPEFRAAANDYSATVSRVLSYLSTYADVAEETAAKILANEVLIQSLSEAGEDSSQFADLIESALARENEQLLKDLQALEVQAEQERQRATSTEALAKQKDAEIQEKLETVTRLQARLDSEQHERERVLQQVADERAASHHRAAMQAKTIEEMEARLRRTKGRTVTIAIVFVALIASAILLFLPRYLQWTWLSQHPNQIGLYISVLLIVWGLAWASIDSKRRWVGGAALVIGALLVFAQIVQR